MTSIHNNCTEQVLRINQTFQDQPARLAGQSGLSWMWSAIVENCPAAVERLRELGVDVNGIDKFDRKPLNYAVERGSLACLQRLLALGADPYGGKYPAPELALNLGNATIAMILLELAPPRTNEEETRWLMSAIKGRCYAGVRYFLDMGYPVNWRDQSSGVTMLSYAATVGDLTIVQMLVDAGVDINQRASRDRTPLMIAIEMGHNDIARWLIECGADPSQRDVNGRTALAMFSASLAKEDPALVRLLAPHEARNTSGPARTGLMAAANRGHIESLRLLLGHSKAIHLTDGEGNTALHHACRGGQPESVRLLLVHGARTDIQNTSSERPLTMLWNSWIAPASRKACIAHLLHYGADVRVLNCQGFFPSQLAAAHGEPDIVELLWQHARSRALLTPDPVDWESHATAAAITQAILTGKKDQVDDLLEKPTIDARRLVQAIASNQQVVMFAAVEHDLIEAVRMLLDGGVSVDICDGDSNTPLNIASRYGRIHIAALLLQRGADIEAQTERGYTPIQFAKDETMVAFLRRHGAQAGANVLKLYPRM